MRIAAALLALATAGATLTLSTGTAFAEESRQLIVQYDDLNLSASAGREKLEARLRSAARSVCAGGQGPELKHILQTRHCETAARSQAWDQITASASSGQVRGAR